MANLTEKKFREMSRKVFGEEYKDLKFNLLCLYDKLERHLAKREKRASDYDPNIVTVEIKVKIPKPVIDAMGIDQVKEDLEAFIRDEEVIDILKEQHEDRTGIWIKT